MALRSKKEVTHSARTYHVSAKSCEADQKAHEELCSASAFGKGRWQADEQDFSHHLEELKPICALGTHTTRCQGKRLQQICKFASVQVRYS